MVQLSIINPQNILPTFANLKLAMFYFKLFWIFFSMGLFLLLNYPFPYLKLAAARITPYIYFRASKSFANRLKLEDILKLLHRGTKSNFIRCVTCLLRVTNAEQPYSICSYQFSLLRWNRTRVYSTVFMSIVKGW